MAVLITTGIEITSFKFNLMYEHNFYMDKNKESSAEVFFKNIAPVTITQERNDQHFREVLPKERHDGFYYNKCLRSAGILYQHWQLIIIAGILSKIVIPVQSVNTTRIKLVPCAGAKSCINFLNVNVVFLFYLRGALKISRQLIGKSIHQYLSPNR